jgi:hypothetical protein
MKRCDRIKGALLVSLTVLTLCGCQALVSEFILPKKGIREAQFAVRVERGAGFRTSDAVELIADVYHPVTKERTPTILVRIPFSKTFKNGLGADAVSTFWASRGYTVVIQGTRGRYKSGGNFYPLRNEREDGLATLQWLSRQPWFDGRLGMWGGSPHAVGARRSGPTGPERTDHPDRQHGLSPDVPPRRRIFSRVGSVLGVTQPRGGG